MGTVHGIHPRSPQEPLHLEAYHEDPDGIAIFVRGDLDMATTPALAGYLATFLHAGTPCRRLVIDLSASAFVDVGGVNVLLGAHHGATDRGVALSLRGCSAQLVRLLHLVHLVDVVVVVPAQRTGAGAGYASRRRLVPPEPAAQ